MRNLMTTLSFAMLLAALAVGGGAGAALADVSCSPGSSAPGCAAPSPVTAAFHGAPEAHNGKKLFAFEIRFSEDFDGLRLGAFKRALQVTGGRVIDVKRTVRGKNGGVTVRVRPSSSGDLTITLAAGTAGGGSLTVPGPATASLPDPVTPPVSEPAPQPVSVPDPQPVSAPTPLTASFHGLPDKHDGKLLSFEIRFSEEFNGLKLGALKQALQVTGGRVVDVKRTVRGKNGSVTVRVRPSSLQPLVISLPATADCAAAGAICTKAGGMLSGSVSANIISTSWGQARRGWAITPDSPPPPSTRSISLGAPAGFAGYTWGSVVDMNNFGMWKIATEEGFVGNGPGQTPNAAPNFKVREHVAAGAGVFAWAQVGNAGGQQVWYKKYYYAYPSGTDTSKTRVILNIDKLGYGGSSYRTDVGGQGGKLDLLEWIPQPYTEFFKADAYLQTQGTLAQPDVTATFTGHVIAATSGVSDIDTRGELIGGDASVTATVSGGAVTAAVSLTNLEATTLTMSSGTDLVPVTFADQSWTGLTVTTGAFSSTSATRKLQGTFRKQNNDNDANTDIVDTVGGLFEINGSDWKSRITGGFVATK